MAIKIRYIENIIHSKNVDIPITADPIIAGTPSVQKFSKYDKEKIKWLINKLASNNTKFVMIQAKLEDIFTN